MTRAGDHVLATFLGLFVKLLHRADGDRASNLVLHRTIRRTWSILDSYAALPWQTWKTRTACARTPSPSALRSSHGHCQPPIVDPVQPEPQPDG